LAINTRPRLVDPKSLHIHPSAHLVPDMRSGEWREFYADIWVHGIKVPLEVLADGTVLDGRHRLRAALELGMKSVPIVDASLDHETPVVCMLKAAVLRRHLSDDQRAAIAVLWMAENKQARAGPGRGHIGEKTSASRHASVLDEPDKTHPTRAKAAEEFKVPRHKLEKATFVQKHNPDLLDKVHRGDIALSNAYRQAKAPLERQTIADTKPLIGTYQVIVIDPPWPFTSRQGDPSHEISSPYESMSIADMQRMSIPARQTVALDAPELSDHLSSKVVKRNGRLTSVTSGK